MPGKVSISAARHDASTASNPACGAAAMAVSRVRCAAAEVDAIPRTFSAAPNDTGAVAPGRLSVVDTCLVIPVYRVAICDGVVALCDGSVALCDWF